MSFSPVMLDPIGSTLGDPIPPLRTPHHLDGSHERYIAFANDFLFFTQGILLRDLFHGRGFPSTWSAVHNRFCSQELEVRLKDFLNRFEL
jgi:hypothetical protein